MKLTLEIQIASALQMQRIFEGEAVMMGRGRECDLIIARPMVSSEHARLDFKDGNWVLTDLFSTNGTFVNGRRISGGVEVSPTDEFQLGEDGPLIKFISCELPAPRPQPIIAPAPQAVMAGPALASAAAPPLPPRSRPASPPLPSVSPVPASPAVRAPRKLSSKIYTRPTVRQRKGTAGSMPAAWFHGVAAVIGLMMSAMALFIYAIYTLRQPARGYTGLGLFAGLVGSAFLMTVGFYTWRKRWGQEQMPGRLQTWLRIHLWLSLVGVWLIFLHAGFNLDGGTGTWTLLALVLTVVTGLVGWAIYVQVPGQVYRQVGNLATGDVEERLRGIQAEIEDASAGGSPELAQFAARVLRGQAWQGFKPSQEDAPAAANILKLGEQQWTLRRRLSRQRRMHFILRVWLVLHIPCSLLFIALLPWHIFDATEAKLTVLPAGPRDYASSESCAKCHQAQYDEWITSMHAIAQSSPVTDLQNRLVLHKEQADLKSGALPQELVGDLCVRCHAPTGRLGSRFTLEDPLIERRDRAPASQFGVSCVACHQIDKLHKSSGSDGLEYKNAENLSYTSGRTMLGQFGDGSSSLPSIGNSEHKGEFRQFFGQSDFCASCHTVTVDDPATKQQLVKLQDTFTEWKAGGGGKSSVNWASSKVECLDCHGRDLSGLSQIARELARDRVPLADRLLKMQEAVFNSQKVPPADQLAASPERNFDQRLPPRRRYLHTFAGVDYHLEKDLPYPADHPRAGENAAIQEKTVRQTQDLLSIAAALRIERQDLTGASPSINVEILNLATGHHLPAGFAFARETWLEVSVSDLASGDQENDWRVLIGGSGGAPLRPTQGLDKRQSGLRNFQAVLYNSQAHQEVVLQNLTDGVLAGKDFDPASPESFSNRQLFPDREPFLVPGEIRNLSIDLRGHEAALQTAKRIRVRLRLRNLPPEFLEGLAKLYDQEGDSSRAQRCRNLIGGLRIFEMTEDVVATAAP